MKKQLLHYFEAMNASALQSAAHAAKAWLAVAGAHAVADTIPALNLNQFGAVLAFAFVTAIFNWLDDHPLPVSENNDEPPISPVVSENQKPNPIP